MKLAITGKGGVGKTTICALLARAFLDNGHRVLVVDADPNATLASCLGFPNPEQIIPLKEMDDLIEERTGVRPGKPGAIFKLNPRVDDIVERYAVTHDGINLLRMGAIKLGGSGCYCPENAFLQTLVSHIFLSEQDVLIMDMEAGVEHFGRGTARGVDWLIVVAEPTRQSIETSGRIKSLAADIGLTRIGVIGNKCQDEAEKEYLATGIAPLPLLGALPYDSALRRAEQEGRPPQTSLLGVDMEIANILAKLMNSG